VVSPPPPIDLSTRLTRLTFNAIGVNRYSRNRRRVYDIALDTSRTVVTKSGARVDTARTKLKKRTRFFGEETREIFLLVLPIVFEKNVNRSNECVACNGFLERPGPKTTVADVCYT